MKYLLIPLTMISTAASAGSITFETMDEVTRWGKSSSSYYEIILQGTQKDTKITCGLTNEKGDIIAVNTTFTDPLATSVLIRYKGNDVKGAICVRN